MAVTPTMEEKKSFWQAQGTKLIALTFWLALIGGYWWYTRSSNLTPTESLQLLATFLTGSTLGGLAYILIYLLRPLIFFPATLLTLLGGFLFGPIWGIIYVVLGSNGSALAAYFVARFFGQDLLPDQEDSQSFVNRYAQRLRDNSFETVLLMRLLFLPYDLVHYVAGFLRIDWRAFILATAIGSIPGTISFVLLGSSFGTLDDLAAGQVSVNPWALGLSVVLIVGSLIVSRILRRRGTLE
ncbi:MAG: TVP38/TMEM64 family protein [Chloroflexota bacterium]